MAKSINDFIDRAESDADFASAFVEALGEKVNAAITKCVSEALVEAGYEPAYEDERGRKPLSVKVGIAIGEEAEIADLEDLKGGHKLLQPTIPEEWLEEQSQLIEHFQEMEGSDDPGEAAMGRLGKIVIPAASNWLQDELNYRPTEVDDVVSAYIRIVGGMPTLLAGVVPWDKSICGEIKGTTGVAAHVTALIQQNTCRLIEEFASQAIKEERLTKETANEHKEAAIENLEKASSLLIQGLRGAVSDSFDGEKVPDNPSVVH